MSKYQASSRESIHQFSRDLLNLPMMQQLDCFAHCIAVGCMKSHWSTNWCFNIIKWRHGEIGIKYLIAKLGLFNSIQQDTIHHLLYGRDRTDKDSVGGFSQCELDDIAKSAGL